MKNPRYVMLAGAAAIILGSFFPWITMRLIFGTLSANGTESNDGIYTIGIGVVVSVFALLAKPAPDQFGSWYGLIGSVLVGFIVLKHIFNIDAFAQEQSRNLVVLDVHAGTGLYAVMAGAVICIVGGLMRWPVPPPIEPPGEDQTGHTPAA